MMFGKLIKACMKIVRLILRRRPKRKYQSLKDDPYGKSAFYFLGDKKMENLDSKEI